MELLRGSQKLLQNVFGQFMKGQFMRTEKYVTLHTTQCLQRKLLFV